jgi:hypothetical protein
MENFIEEDEVALAQVAYQISRDTDFAARMRIDPEGTLAEKGFVLSREELAFLSRGLRGDSDQQVTLDDLVAKMRGWR